LQLPFPLVEGLSALQSLSLLRLAEEHDRQRREAAPPARLRVANVSFKRQVAVDLMALVIVRAAAARGLVHRLDFEQVGFTAQQIDELRLEAFARACLNEPRLHQMLEAA
jgi:hypothetical protein